MPERFPGREPERIPIDHQVFDLNEGPIDITLSDHEIRIVEPERDLGERWNVDCMVIDPNDYYPEQDRGYKGLRDGEEIVLGRKYSQGRFEFSPYVSARHVRLSRLGSQVSVHDLGSTNGTYQLVQPQAVPGTSRIGTQPVGGTLPEFDRGSAKLAGLSIPSDRHPERNEDAFFIDEANGALGVFDGVGGASGSERASQLASKAVAENLKKVHLMLPRSLSHIAIYEALWAGHEAILDDPAIGIATTATVAKVFETERGTPYVVVASVGDSRAYLFRDGQLAHLTLDQAYRMPGHKDEDSRHLQETLANATDLSKLDEAAQRAFRNRNIITSYLGGESNPPVITVSDFEAHQGDKLVITSDGIHDNLTDNEIEAIVRDQSTAGMTVRALVRASQSRSQDRQHLRAKPDDMTAAVLSV